MPWVLFDASADTLVISPASHFFPSTLLGDGTSQIASGFNSSLANVPAGFTQQTMMSVSRGINRTLNAWGSGLTNLYSRANPANDADVLLRYFGIWTDAGANYYYNYNSNATASGQSAYGATLGGLMANFGQMSIPVRYCRWIAGGTTNPTSTGMAGTRAATGQGCPSRHGRCTAAR